MKNIYISIIAAQTSFVFKITYMQDKTSLLIHFKILKIYKREFNILYAYIFFYFLKIINILSLILNIK